MLLSCSTHNIWTLWLKFQINGVFSFNTNDQFNIVASYSLSLSMGESHKGLQQIMCWP